MPLDPFAELALGIIDKSGEAILAEVRELRMVFMPHADTKKGARILKVLDLIEHYVEATLLNTTMPLSPDTVELSCQHAVSHHDLKTSDPAELGTHIEKTLAHELAMEIVTQSLMDVREISTKNQSPDTSIIRGRVRVLKPKP